MLRNCIQAQTQELNQYQTYTEACILDYNLAVYIHTSYLNNKLVITTQYHQFSTAYPDITPNSSQLLPPTVFQPTRPINVVQPQQRDLVQNPHSSTSTEEYIEGERELIENLSNLPATRDYQNGSVERLVQELRNIAQQ